MDAFTSAVLEALPKTKDRIWHCYSFLTCARLHACMVAPTCFWPAAHPVLSGLHDVHPSYCTRRKNTGRSMCAEAAEVVAASYAAFGGVTFANSMLSQLRTACCVLNA